MRCCLQEEVEWEIGELRGNSILDQSRSLQWGSGGYASFGVSGGCLPLQVGVQKREFTDLKDVLVL